MPSRTILPASGVIAVLGGALMILGGLATNSLFLWILPLLRQEILDRIPSPANSAAELAVYIIALLVSLGGVTVILGGIPLLAGHRTTGRLLVALGGGAGFIGLILALGYYTWVNGIGGVGAHAGYWAGVVLAVIARWLAGKG
ncbi:MAG: hypothetical protein JRN09_07310 [Nitrososphaerota archaeon]|jgi:hypothetical protein|nr:hypothetical protein [Nitrososphaerota archaeon]